MEEQVESCHHLALGPDSVARTVAVASVAFWEVSRST